MKDIKKGQDLEVTVNELVEEYYFLLTESMLKSFQKQGRFTGDTKTSVKAQLENQFESVKMITKKGRYGGTIFELKGFKGVVGYNPYKNNSRPSIDWTNEINCIRELINQEVALGKNENFYKGFTVNQLLNKMLGFDKYKIKAIAKDEVENHDIFKLSGNVNDEFGLRDTVNSIVRNQRNIYVAMIEKELSKTNHNISYLDSNKNKIDEKTNEEYVNFKNKLASEIKAENNKLKELKNKYFNDGLSTKDFDIKNEVQLVKEVDNAVKEKFGFKYAYRLFNVFDEIQVGGEGYIDKVRKNYFNRIMKNASSSQNKHEQTEEINYSETVFFRLVHAGLYVQVMDSVFSKLVNFESNTESNIVDVLDNSVAEDDETYQEFLFGLEQYESEQEEYDYYYVDVERILYEMKNPLSDEECEKLYKDFFEY